MSIYYGGQDPDPTHSAGYRAGMRQPSLRTSIEFIVPPNVDLPRLDKELRERFGIDTLPPDSRIARELNDAERSAQLFAWQTMALALELLNAIRIPCFARGVLLDLTTLDAARSLYRASFLFPVVEGVSVDWIVRCMAQARQLLVQLASPALTDAAAQALLDHLHESFVEECRKQIYGGDATIPVLKTAFGLGVPFLHVGAGIYQLGWGKHRRLSDRSASDLDAAIAVRATQNKVACAQMLRQAGLPAPVHGLAASVDDAIVLAEKMGFPVVVKPADCDRGEGVTIDINDTNALASAFDKAAAFSRSILVERQVPGVCHRILIAGNTLAYVVGRLPMGVKGDGTHTIRQLIALVNDEDARKAKHLRDKPQPCDELAEHTLASQGLRLDDILEAEQMGWLRPIESTEWGGLPDVATDRIHPDNLRIAIEATRCMGLQVAGVDLITTDISQPWYETGAIINEVNFTPYLGLMFDYQRAGVLEVVRGLTAHGTRIPVEVFVGDRAAMTAARARQQALAAGGTKAFLTSHNETHDGDQVIRMALAHDGLFQRCRALLVNSQVEAILLVIQTDELLSSGLPVDAIDRLEVTNQRLLNASNQKPLSPAATESLLNLLRLYMAAARPADELPRDAASLVTPA